MEQFTPSSDLHRNILLAIQPTSFGHLTPVPLTVLPESDNPKGPADLRERARALSSDGTQPGAAN